MWVALGRGAEDPSQEVALSPEFPVSGAPAAGAAHEYAPLFEAGTDRNAFDRVLLAWAVHPDGPGFARAHLLLWERTLECLEGRLAWHAPDAERVPGSLA